MDAKRHRPLALIPGVYWGTDPSQSHGFLQVFDGGQKRAWYQRFGADEFVAHARDMDVHLGGNHFRLANGGGHLRLDVELDDLHLRGEVELRDLSGWPVRPWSPGVMGPFGLIPFLECYHGVVGFDPTTSGTLSLGDEVLDFDGGRAYVEKDWGSSFPQSWIWCQCNHFERSEGAGQRVCLTASIAEIPNLGRTFPGFIVGLWIDGELFPFTTHHLAGVDVLVADDSTVRWVLHNRRHRLEITIVRAEPTSLPGPTIEGMQREVHETLLAQVEVRLSQRFGARRVVYAGHGECAGLEVQGDIPHLARVAGP